MCDCIEKANKILAEHNTVITTRMTMNLATGKEGFVVLIPTEKLNKRGKSAKALFPLYCALCGEKRSKP